jgi:hypothetical protein
MSADRLTGPNMVSNLNGPVNDFAGRLECGLYTHFRRV